LEQLQVVRRVILFISQISWDGRNDLARQADTHAVSLLHDGAELSVSPMCDLFELPARRLPVKSAMHKKKKGNTTPRKSKEDCEEQEASYCDWSVESS
jgi:hypothetical protein